MRSTRLYIGERQTACVNLHPVRFTLPSSVTVEAVGSYPSFSPLPRRAGAVCFLWHYLAIPVCPISPAVSCGTVFAGVRTFLSGCCLAEVAGTITRKRIKLFFLWVDFVTWF